VWYTLKKEMRTEHGVTVVMEMEVRVYPREDKPELFSYKTRIAVLKDDEVLTEIILPKRIAHTESQLVYPFLNMKETITHILEYMLSLF